MRHGIVLFTSDRGITPAEAARAAEDAGFHTFYVPEHTHIPVRRTAHVLATSKPTPELLESWEAAGVTEAIWGLPDRPAEDVVAFLGRHTARLGLA